MLQGTQFPQYMIKNNHFIVQGDPNKNRDDNHKQ